MSWKKGYVWGVALVTLLALSLAACGEKTTEPSETSPAEGNGTPTLNLSGPTLGFGEAAEDQAQPQLPGCSDPSDEECPAALRLTLDGEASADSVHINYPARYFVARSGADAPENVLIVIEPSERNKYDERAVFELYWADSVEAAVSALDSPESAQWQTDTLQGVIAVSKDTTQDPPVTTTIGAMRAPDGRVIVLKLTTTGKYGWDLWSRVYDDMLASLRVE